MNNVQPQASVGQVEQNVSSESSKACSHCLCSTDSFLIAAICLVVKAALGLAFIYAGTLMVLGEESSLIHILKPVWDLTTDVGKGVLSTLNKIAGILKPFIDLISAVNKL